jgi:hypothetical protein
VEKACCNIIDEASEGAEPVSQEARAVCQEADHHLRLGRHLPGSLSFCKKGNKLVIFKLLSLDVNLKASFFVSVSRDRAWIFLPNCGKIDDYLEPTLVFILKKDPFPNITYSQSRIPYG